MRHIRFLAVNLLLVLSGHFALAQNDVLGNVERFGRAMVYINNNYIDTVDFDALTDASIREVMSRLDPHSTFISKDDVKSVNEPLEGSFEGIGIEFAIIADTLTVQSVIIGGPSELVGLAAGDKIVKVDGEDISGRGITNSDVYGYLRGPKGSTVNLTVLRRDFPQPLEFSIVRGRIPLSSIDAAYCPAPGILYVKISRFAQSTVQEFVESVKLQDEFPRGMIIDLRGNAGGYLHTALRMANIFLERGQMILFTEGRNSPMRKEYANGMGFFASGPLVVMVDGDSASASEILAGALQDWDRGVVVGRRTFGKGLVQQQFELSDGSQMRLTVARYHTPSGRVIQSPYEKGHAEEYYGRLYERYSSGEIFSRDSVSFPDSLKFSTLRLGRTVYGGGGIMPDVFVPRDTSGINDYFSKVIRGGHLLAFANDFCDKHRSQLSVEGRSFGEFCDYYDSFLAEEAFEGLLSYCGEHGVERDLAQIAGCGKLLRTRLKALAARTRFGTTGYYRVINMEEDPDFEAAMNVVRSWTGTFPSL